MIDVALLVSAPPELEQAVHTAFLRRISMGQASWSRGQATVYCQASQYVRLQEVPRWKRKGRLVIRGNHIDMEDSASLFATGASESLRIALCSASNVCWSEGSTDITGAFLLAARPSDKSTYGVLAPKILAQAGLAKPDDVFLVRRPLSFFASALSHSHQSLFASSVLY